MDESTLEQTRRWVRIWKETGPLLEQIKKEELRAMTEKERCARVVRLLSTPPPKGEYERKPSTTSGMVEQQRGFMLLRERLAGK